MGRGVEDSGQWLTECIDKGFISTETTAEGAGYGNHTDVFIQIFPSVVSIGSIGLATHVGQAVVT